MIKFEKLPADVLSRLPEAKRLLNQEDNIVFAYLFGGLTKGEAHHLSDVDIAVYLKQTKDLAAYKLALFEKLSDVLGTAELDLVILNTAPVSLAGRILQNKDILADKVPFARHSYESLTLRKFFDFKVKEDAFFKRRFGIG